MQRRGSLSSWLPVLVVLAGFCWAYYAYVHVFCPVLVADHAERVSLSALFHLILFLALWSFLRAVTASIPPVPSLYSVNAPNRRMIADCKAYQERKEILEALGSSRGILTRAADGSVRYCEQCGLIKPDRCHHCSCCRRCILKMDHHCPWLNNCVAFSTYKFFLLTLFYVVLLSTYTFVTVSSYALDTATAMGLPTGVLVHTGFLLLAGTALTVLIGGFFGVHVRILCRNETTLETMRPFLFVESLDSFDLGVRRNVVQVFGSSVYLWPFPVHSTPGDGVRFPTKLYPDPGTTILTLMRQRSRQVALSLCGQNLPVVSPSMETALGDLVPSPGATARHVSTTTGRGEPGKAIRRPERDAYHTALETTGLSLSSTSEQYRSGLTVSAVNGGGTVQLPATPPPGLISPIGARSPLQRLGATSTQGSSVVVPQPTLLRTGSQTSFVSVQTR
ncbi:hypothetical protein HPB52_004441 [Rhipicephalus sanguineus]|uniref:Palmitoyltransferase n=2 Tax=Rhipicephalus sanguineus TaxID=34632 RepID=A0A9D4PLR7_RHISA|nr:hypothetical protein HPB52_004441 [Rhipicephalus sanguineus]